MKRLILFLIGIASLITPMFGYSKKNPRRMNPKKYEATKMNTLKGNDSIEMKHYSHASHYSHYSHYSAK